MDIESLKRANELVDLINTTERGIVGIKKITQNGDNCYWLTVSKHNDGSGDKGVLNRSEGNKEVVDAILQVLEMQLREFKGELEVL